MIRPGNLLGEQLMFHRALSAGATRVLLFNTLDPAVKRPRF
ncbi:MAG: hypothetical protein OEW92_10175 [Gammaproteobacteria bacterium]|jgi:hypothetical protein|nr:hypothetical protein [Gammaproteobacteria bacterium]